MYIFGYCSWGLYVVRIGHSQCCIATPRYRRRRLPPDGWWPLAVTGGISQSELCYCREQTCLNIFI